jgi:hypothetical protein
MTHEENRARTAHLRQRGAFLCTRGSVTPTEADLDAVEAFAAYLRETPKGLGSATPVHLWPSLFPDRAAFDVWRARWWPYLRGEADGPTES